MGVDLHKNGFLCQCLFLPALPAHGVLQGILHVFSVCLRMLFVSSWFVFILYFFVSQLDDTCPFLFSQKFRKGLNLDVCRIHLLVQYNVPKYLIWSNLDVIYLICHLRLNFDGYSSTWFAVDCQGVCVSTLVDRVIIFCCLPMFRFFKPSFVESPKLLLSSAGFGWFRCI